MQMSTRKQIHFSFSVRKEGLCISFSLWHRNAWHHKCREERRGNLGALRCCVNQIVGVEKWLLSFFYSHLIFLLVSLSSHILLACAIYFSLPSRLSFPFTLWSPSLSCLFPWSVLSSHLFSLALLYAHPFLSLSSFPLTSFLPSFSFSFLPNRFRGDRTRRRLWEETGKGGGCCGNHRWFFTMIWWFKV